MAVTSPPPQPKNGKVKQGHVALVYIARWIVLFAPLLGWLIACSGKEDLSGTSVVTRWQDGKKAAISITLDDGSINQFRQALPIMNRLDFQGTFFIITGDIPGSEFKPQYSGRPAEEILKESAIMPTNDANVFERASMVHYLNIENALNYHTEAGALYEQGKKAEAYRLIDEGLAKARAKNARIRPAKEPASENTVTWEEIRKYAGQGHEFGSHTVSHPRLAVLDEKNMLYELEKSKEEILNHLGNHHTFSAECPFGTEDERAVSYASKIYPALRNRMPEDFLQELNRWNEMTPGSSTKEYVQWQRGPLAETPMDLMKSWVDTLVVNDNIWLVLVFHGVDGIGWEAKPHEQLEEYFNYIKAREDRLWVATFGDVTRYMRERMNAKVTSRREQKHIVVEVSHNLDKEAYALPLTLKTYVPKEWGEVLVRQGQETIHVSPEADEKGFYVMYQARPNADPVQIIESD